MVVGVNAHRGVFLFVEERVANFLTKGVYQRLRS